MDSEAERQSKAGPDELALDWFARVQRGLSEAEEKALRQWLGASPAHQSAYRRAASLWAAAEAPGARVAAEEEAALQIYLKKMDRAKARGKATKRGASVLGFALVLLGGAWLTRPDFLTDIRADYVAPHAKRQVVALPDGSTVLLDADSALAQHFTNGERRVALLRGNAFFSIEKTGTPFIVETAQGDVEVLGTRFDVCLTQEDATVTVAQGVVAVSPKRQARMAATLKIGQQVSFRSGGIGDVQAVDIRKAMTWHDGRFAFYEMRFADVIAEVQRYRRDRLFIMNNDLANRRVTGSFSLDDPDSALASLQATINFESRSVAGYWTILR